MEKAVIEENLKLEEWVISMLEQENADIRLIAREGGFGDHRMLGRYMLKKGYVWLGETGNYVKASDHLKTAREELYDEMLEVERGLGTSKGRQDTNMEDLSKYLPVLDTLHRNQERLSELLEQNREVCIPGWMNKLVLEFCHDHKLSRQQVYEAAIYEFLDRYKESVEIG